MKSNDITKVSRGYKNRLIVDVEEYPRVNEGIRWAYLNATKTIKAEHKPTFKDSKGNVVEKKYISETPRVMSWRVKGKIEQVAVGEIQAYNDKDKPIKKFDKTDEFKVIATLPLEKKQDFEITQWLQLWGESTAKLLEFAKALKNKEEIGVCKVVLSEGYDTQRLALVEAVFINGNFTFRVGLTLGQFVYEHLLDLKSKAKAVEVVFEPEELDVLKLVGV